MRLSLDERGTIIHALEWHIKHLQRFLQEPARMARQATTPEEVVAEIIEVKRLVRRFDSMLWLDCMRDFPDSLTYCDDTQDYQNQ